MTAEWLDLALGMTLLALILVPLERSYYSTTGPIAVDPTTCAISSGADVKPLGR